MRLGAINGLRGIAILAVFFIHLLGSHYPRSSGWFGQIIWAGWFGVPLFFLLSGFVLYLPFVHGRTLGTAAFYRHRLARLYPLYIIAALVSILIASDAKLVDPRFWTYVATAVVPVYFFAPDHHGVIGNGALWSLAVEFYLSALFPLLAIAISRFGALTVSASIFTATLLLKAAYVAVGFGPPTTSGPAPLLAWKLLVVMQSLTEFTLGMWLAELWARGGLERLKPYATPLFLLSGAALVWFVSMQAAPNDAFRSGLALSFYPIADSLLVIVVASALALPQGLVHGALTTLPLQLVGAMCFSIYVWHIPMMRQIASGIPFSGPLDAVVFTLGSLVVILGFSILSYRFIEFPERPWRALFTFPRGPAGKSGQWQP